MAKTKLSRRNFLEALGASAALVPLLGMDEAHGATPTRRRLVTAAWTNGFWRQELWPEGEGSDYKLKKILSPLEPYRKHLLVVAGVRLQNFIDTRGKKTGDAGAGHDAFPAVFTGAPLAEYAEGSEKAGGDSIDQYVADRLNAGTPFKSLVVAGHGGGSGYGNTTSYKGVGSSGVTPEADPSRLFKTLFEGRSLPKGEIDKSFLRRASILDHVGKDLEKFSGRVGADDKMRIQQHMQSVRELEQQITALSKGVQCEAPSGVNVGGGRTEYGKEDSQYPARLAAQTKLIAAAIRCDLTRVVNFTMEDNGGDVVMSFLGSEFTGGGDEFPTRTHHDIAHNRKKSAAHAARYTRVSQWFFEHIALLAKELGPDLDSTLIAVSSPMHHNHTVVGIPFVILGGSWYYKTNRFVKLGPWKGTSGGAEGNPLSDDGWWSKNEGALLPHNGILVSIANAMGVPTQFFGPEKYGGEMPELRG